jgi:hypothetical protein
LLLRGQTLECVISAKEWSWEKLNASDKMPIEFYGSNTISWSRRTLSFIARSWMCPLLMIFYPSGNQQDVSGFEEEFLVDKNEARISKVCVRV